MKEKYKITVFLSRDYTNSESFYMDKSYNKDQITDEVNKRFKMWYYYDID